MLGRDMVLLNGSDGHQVVVDKLQVVFIEEITIQGNKVSNVHFTNTRWVTVSMSVAEVMATLGFDQQGTDDEDAKHIERLKKEAKMRRKFSLAAQEAIQESGLFVDGHKKLSHHIETQADGTRKITIVLEPAKVKDKEDPSDLPLHRQL